MIFQNKDGSLIIINRCDYKNDYIYYNTIYELIKQMKINSSK
jgi:hypothetical protein